MTRVLAFLISLRPAGWDLPFHKQRGAEVFLRPFSLPGVPPHAEGPLVTTQGPLAAPLQRIDLEWLREGRPVAIGEQPVV